MISAVPICLMFETHVACRSLLARLGEHREQDRRDDGDDRYHDEQLDECKAAFHSHLLPLRFVGCLLAEQRSRRAVVSPRTSFDASATGQVKTPRLQPERMAEGSVYGGQIRPEP